MTEEILILQNISKTFYLDKVEVCALRNISLKIKKGEFVAIMGPSGSGKSTLMSVMGCLDTPTKGKVIFEGKKLAALAENDLAKIRNRKIGFVFQMFNLLPRTTALANVELPLIYSRVPAKVRRKRALEVLGKLGLTARANHFPSQLSGGEQQRVAIARAIVTNPTIIFADEPTGNLDTKSGSQIMEIFKKLNQEGNTLVIVTHDREIAKHAQRLIKIRDGKLV